MARNSSHFAMRQGSRRGEWATACGRSVREQSLVSLEHADWIVCPECKAAAVAARDGLAEEKAGDPDITAGVEETPPQSRSIAMLDLMRLECSYLNDRPVVFMDDLYKLAKPNVGDDRARQLRDAVCAILSSTGKYSHDIPRLATEALARDNNLLDAAASGADIPKALGLVELEPR